MQKYKLLEAIVGVCRGENARVQITTLPAGALLTVGTPGLRSGLVDALWENQHVSVFAQDLESRAELIQASGSTP